MKKSISVLIFALVAIITVNAQLPYSKLMELTPEELIGKNFKFNEKKNQYVLTKTDALTMTANVLGALSGSATTYQPSAKDYKITIQYGIDNLVSSLSNEFYSDDTFNEIQTWLAENNIQTTNSASGKISITKFLYDSLNVELKSQAVIQSQGSTTVNRYSGVNSNSIDKSYTAYTYTIETGIPPYSEWHLKEQKKKEKRKAQGKKDDLNDLM